MVVVLYDTYKFNRKQHWQRVIAASGFIFISGYLFFGNIIIPVLLLPISLYYPKVALKIRIAKRKETLTMQFKDALFCISSSISSGKSIINSFKDVHRELAILYPERNTFIIAEFEYISHQLELNVPFEKVVHDFASRTNVDAIVQFSQTIQICIFSGGNLVEAIKNTTNVIIDKIRMQNEITVLTAEQNLNIKILLVIPYVIFISLYTTSYDYILSFYTPIGNIVMGIVLLLIGAAYFAGKKIVQIKT